MAHNATAITMNRIQAGQRLVESDLSEVPHVSRAPLREALRILERERPVEFRARHGAVVTAPDVHDLLNLAMTDLSSNRLIVDLLTSISLRTLRYVRLGLATDPGLAAFVSEELNLAWCRQPVFHAKAWHSLKLAHVVRD